MIRELFDLTPCRYGRYDMIEVIAFIVSSLGGQFAIYGRGCSASLVSWMFKRLYGIAPAFFVSRGEERKKIDGIPLVSEEDFKQRSADRKFIVVIAEESYRNGVNPAERVRIREYLDGCGIELYWGAASILNPFKPAWWQFIREHVEQFEELHRRLPDQVSKDTLVEYLKTYVLGQRYQGKTYPEQYKYWGIEDEHTQLFRITEEEVLLNLGAASGDTIFQYIKCGLPYKKMIAVEAGEANCSRIRKALSYLPHRQRQDIVISQKMFGYGCDTLDQCYCNEKITLINMDIEGSELDVLNTGIKMLKEYRPVLAVCAYHKMDDLLTISSFVKGHLDGYVLSLRKYPSAYWDYIDGIQQINELVLYAIPEERYTGKEHG